MKKKIPKHIAIIPDGNRRWAKKHNLKPWDGHYEGAKRFEELVDEAFDLGVKSITFWGSSVDNLTKRPWREKKALLNIYEKYFKKLMADKRVFENKIKINILGKWQEQFPDRLVNLLKRGIERTKNHNKFNLNFLLAYNGDDDILTAVKKIINKKYKAEDINNEIITENLMSNVVSPIDLVIRTGVEDDPHNSAGFLMWQTQNSQLYFTNLQFPEFTANKLKMAIEDFSQRERRLGK
jgi:tritrans,polycis-undecaprenyl-diphosphate synthase [geranylgeranyl-diphosphate specific]